MLDERLTITVLDRIPEPIMIMKMAEHHQFTIEYVNQAFIDMGYVSADDVGRPIQDVLPTALFEELSRCISLMVLSGTASTNKLNYNGSSYPFIFLPSLDEKGRYTHVLVIAADIVPEGIRKPIRSSDYKLFESLLEQVPDAVMIADTNAKILMVNKAFEDMFGWSKAEVKGITYQDSSFVPEDREHEKQALLQMLEKEQQINNFITRRLRKDGSEIDVSLSTSAIRDHLGHIIWFSAVYRDITESKVKERLLLESEQRFKSLFDYNPDAVFSCDRFGRFVSVNPKLTEIVGYTNEQLEELSFETFVHPDDLQQSIDNFQKVLEGHAITHEYRITHTSGHYIQMKVTAFPIYVNDEVVGIYGIGKDVTDLNNTQQHLLESEQRYKSLFDHNPDAVFSFDLKGNLVSVNEMTSILSGYSSEELIGQSIYKFCHPDDVHTASNHVTAVIANQETINYEIRILHRNNDQYFIMNVTNLPIVIRGETVGVFAIAKNVTPLREAERERKESEERLKSLFEHNPDTIYTLDLEGNFQSFNSSLYPTLGYKPEELIGRSFELLLHPDDLQHTQTAFAAAIKGGVTQYNVRCIRKDEKVYKTLMVTNFPIYVNGENVGVYGIAKDITELVKVQHALIESEERHRKIVELSPNPILMLHEGIIQFANQAAAECLGVQDRSILTGQGFADYVHPDSQNSLQRIIERIYTEGAVNEPAECVIQRADSSQAFVEVVGTWLETIDQNILTLLILRDVTKRKKSEQMIAFMAYHDTLTELPNRSRFHQLVSQSFEENETGALFFMILIDSS